MRERCLRVIGWTGVVVVSVAILYVSFSQPELTQTQLFLQYWWLYVPGVLFAALVGWFSSKRT